ncbi:MAG TPA: 4a-hydroxytetrahydrobiopterin dehydratase [Candidatus Paceibacterota bacterium]|nr:4a-hydroxytetrahydrobiopterin dehydratase [Candidatus Paceibacterota bacterium]
MEKPNILSPEDIQTKLKDMPGWQYADDKISKQFEFNDFMDALGFINKLAPYFESMDHHPDMHIFYSKILFELQRFDVGGKVTDRDLEVASEIEKEYAAR